MHMLKKHKYKILVGLLCVIFLAAVIPPAIKFLREGRQAAIRGSCGNNLHALGVNLNMNADELDGEIKGTYPPMSSEANKLMFTTEGFLPKYIPAPELLVCPSQVSKGIPQEFDDASYFYTGYALFAHGHLISARELESCADIHVPRVYSPFDTLISGFLDFYNKQIASAGDFKERFVREGEIDIYRLREGIRAGCDEILDWAGDDAPLDGVTTTATSVPVLIEWPDIHSSEKLGGHVLWLDGHVRWVEYPGEFPMTEDAMAIFTELAGRPPIGQLD
jgi:prepilin-type processing-associated H-X9-DG protein